MASAPQTSKPLTFHLLPSQAIVKISAYSAPQEVTIAGGKQEANNPLLSLLVVFPSVASLINHGLYSTARFDFGPQGSLDGSLSCEIALDFFKRIGPVNFSSMKHIRIHADKGTDFNGLLAQLAACPPARDIENIDWGVSVKPWIFRREGNSTTDRSSFPKPPTVSTEDQSNARSGMAKLYTLRKDGQWVVSHSCFVIVGLPGIDLQFALYTGFEEEPLSAAELLHKLPVRRVAGSSFDFCALPLELREMIYGHLIPSVYNLNPQRMRRVSRNCKGIVHRRDRYTPGLGIIQVNRRISNEVLSSLYRHCVFSIDQMGDYPLDSRVEQFLRKIGIRNARNIRYVELKGYCMNLNEIRRRESLGGSVKIRQIVDLILRAFGSPVAKLDVKFQSKEIRSVYEAHGYWFRHDDYRFKVMGTGKLLLTIVFSLPERSWSSKNEQLFELYVVTEILKGSL